MATIFPGAARRGVGEGARPEDALTTVEEGLAIARATGELYLEAELHRVTGELLLIRSAKDALRTAEASFRAALKSHDARGLGRGNSGPPRALGGFFKRGASTRKRVHSSHPSVSGLRRGAPLLISTMRRRC